MFFQINREDGDDAKVFSELESNIQSAVAKVRDNQRRLRSVEKDIPKLIEYHAEKCRVMLDKAVASAAAKKRKLSAPAPAPPAPVA